MARLLHECRAAHPPWYVLLGLLIAVALLPGGIPLSTAAMGLYLRRARRLATAGSETQPLT
ncbi:MAG: hypothetical protein H6744_05365 [Deltaproteobacteria bacterium]|nr:hypothetical protein [Deltaproteobacteria bacterium]MCB9786107.1 hypothetical protein [Deltaproteobacteria bacterium]